MATAIPFYMWSIVKAWDWLVHLPVAGFALLVIVGLFVLWIIYRIFTD